MKRTVMFKTTLTPKEIQGVYWSSLSKKWGFSSEMPHDLDALIQLYQGTPVHRELRQCKALVSKVPGKGPLLKEAALRTWKQSEESCRISNMEIPSITDTSDSPLAARLDRARALILRAIGEFTHRKYRRVLALAYDGPGVSLGTSDRTRTAPVYKSLETWTKVTCTPEAKPMAVDYYRRSPSSAIRELSLVTVDGVPRRGVHLTSSNRVGFVPKSSTTFRSIAIEPLVNLRLQLGVHRFLQPILERRCISILSDQRINQELARLGSLTHGLDGLATIDLSAASDTISRELVRRLLPESWYTFLDDLRCKTSIVEGEVVELEKFSSMGNGFTFVLESLIFWALSESCRLEANAGLLSITYGDDIICPTASALLLVETLGKLGLSVNPEKSFFFGSFRESCGADWESGELVTPVYLRRQTVTVMDVHRILNHFGVIREDASLKQYLLRRYSESRPLVFGLENEDPGSCIFTTLEYLKGSGQGRYSSHLQCWQFRGFQTTGIDYIEDEETACLSALLGGARSTPARGRVRTQLRWMTAGRPVGTQRLIR